MLKNQVLYNISETFQIGLGLKDKQILMAKVSI